MKDLIARPDNPSQAKNLKPTRKGLVNAGAARRSFSAAPHAAVSWCKDHWSGLAVTGVILGAVVLATWWVFWVPMLQAPDENQHVDYVFSIYTSGRLLSGRDGPAQVIVHPFTSYLIDKTNFQELIFHANVKVSKGYGSPGYFAGVDRQAPKVPIGSSLGATPWLLTVYPFGYYVLVAGWLGIVHLFTSSLVALFFAARLMSVALLACTLALTYGIAREIRLSRPYAVLSVGTVGFFPLTTFVSSYVQPDNLGFTMVSLSLYLALVTRRRVSDWRFTAMLGAALGILLITKYQFYFCVLLPVLAMLAGCYVLRRARFRDWARSAALLMAPSVLLGLVQLWVLWGAQATYSATMSATFQAGQVNYARFHDALSHGLASLARYTAQEIGVAYSDYFGGGTSAVSFWGQFGWLDTPLTIGPLQTNSDIRFVIKGLTLLIIMLIAVQTSHTLFRLVRLARHGRWRSAMALATADPLMNSLLLFTLFMFGLYVVTSNTFGAQGRNWLPFLVPLFLAATVFAPRSIPFRQARLWTGRLMFACLAAYSAFGSVNAVKAIQARYYGPNQSLDFQVLNGLRVSGLSTAYSIDGVNNVPPPGVVARSTPLPVPSKGAITVVGWAIDVPGRSAAAGVFVTVDDRQNYTADYGLDRPDVGSTVGRQYENSGFVSTFSVQGIPTGRHYLRLKIVNRSRTAFYEPVQQIPFVVQ